MNPDFSAVGVSHGAAGAGNRPHRADVVDDAEEPPVDEFVAMLRFRETEDRSRPSVGGMPGRGASTTQPVHPAAPPAGEMGAEELEMLAEARSRLARARRRTAARRLAAAAATRVAAGADTARSGAALQRVGSDVRMFLEGVHSTTQAARSSAPGSALPVPAAPYEAHRTDVEVRTITALVAERLGRDVAALRARRATPPAPAVFVATQRDAPVSGGPTRHGSRADRGHARLELLERLVALRSARDGARQASRGRAVTLAAPLITSSSAELI
mmetsp:Transcript_7184/g.25656  ORF Transcript_7184/g.25656 Transcript_7184/m.25656 type:complete len:272 (-) Transcript_7184:1802-2617(-)